MSENGSPVGKTAPKEANLNTRDVVGRFDDTLPVYTAPSGTQSVLPFDLLFTTEELKGYLAEVREQGASTD